MAARGTINVAVVALITLACFVTTKASKVLLLTAPVYSHCKSAGAIGESLSKLGHAVTAYVPYHWESKDCLNQRYIDIINYGENMNSFPELSRVTGSSEGQNTLTVIRNISTTFCSSILSDGPGLKTLTTMQFDLAVVDTSPPTKCYLLIPYKLGIPYVSFASVFFWFDTGKPFLPQMESPVLSNPGEMTLVQRLSNTCIMLGGAFVLPWLLRGDSVIAFAPELSFFEHISLVRKSLLFIQDDDVIMSGALPVMPNTIFTGGFSPRPAQPLPQELEQFFLGAIDGVIVVSFGSYARIPDAVIRMMEDVFRDLPQRVLLKGEIHIQLENTLTREWIPQNDVLGNERTKLFLAHCGRNGVYEAIYHGVPVICFPQRGDQPLVASNIERLGIGFRMDMKQLSTDSLRNAISTILTDNRFSKKSKNISKLYRKLHPHPGGDIAARAIDLVMEFGGNHVRPHSLDMSIFSVLLLDVWIIVLAIIFTVSSVSCLFCCWICRCLNKRKLK